MWNLLLNINSLLYSLAWTYAIFSLGASVYFLTWVPIAIAAGLVSILTCTEIAFGVLDLIAG